MKAITHRATLLPLLYVLTLLGLSLPAGAHEGMDHQGHQARASEAPQRSQARYEVPDVILTDASGKKLPLRALLAEPTPLLLNFIFTSCTSVCPVMSGVFAEVQTRLGGLKARLVSISIDPEHDTPALLQDYARNFSAGPDWLLLTGRLQDSIAIQRAFDAYRGDKMTHLPTTFLRAAPDQPWLRVDGLASAADLVLELRRLTARQAIVSKRH